MTLESRRFNGGATLADAAGTGSTALRTCSSLVAGETTATGRGGDGGDFGGLLRQQPH